MAAKHNAQTAQNAGRQRTRNVDTRELSSAMIVDGATTATILIRLNGRIAHYGDGARRLFKYPAEEIIGAPITELLPQIQPILEKPQSAADRPPSWRRVRGLSKNGRHLELKASCQHLRISGKAYIAITLDDAALANRMRAQLRATQTHLEKIVPLSDDGIISVNLDGVIKVFSHGAERMFGYDARDVVGQHLDMLLPASLRAMHAKHMSNFVATKEKTRRMGQRTEILALHKSGETFPVDASIMHFDLAGERMLTAILRDATERKRQEQALKSSERLFRAVFEQTFQFVGLLTPDGIVIELNRSSLEIGGLTRHCTVGRPFAEAAWWHHRPDAGKAEIESLIVSAAAGHTVHKELEIQGSDHRVHVLDFILKPIRDESGAVTLLIADGRDISERVGAECALREAMKHAELANRSKSEFLANMSHELRTPLNAIIGFAEVMLRETFGPLGSSRYQSYCSDIYTAGTHLLSVINDVLDVAKIEAGGLMAQEEEVDVRAALSTCAQMVRDRAEAAGLYLNLEVDPKLATLITDERLLKQMVLNLLSNAVKFTPKGGIAITAERSPDGKMVIAVADTGIGMLATDIPKALQAFGQIDSTFSRQFGGTGLGLHLVRSMVELQGGALALESDQGVGTTAKLIFPAERRRPMQSPTISTVRMSGR